MLLYLNEDDTQGGKKSLFSVRKCRKTPRRCGDVRRKLMSCILCHPGDAVTPKQRAARRAKTPSGWIALRPKG